VLKSYRLDGEFADLEFIREGSHPKAGQLVTDAPLVLDLPDGLLMYADRDAILSENLERGIVDMVAVGMGDYDRVEIAGIGELLRQHRLAVSLAAYAAIYEQPGLFAPDDERIARARTAQTSKM